MSETASKFRMSSALAAIVVNTLLLPASVSAADFSARLVDGSVLEGSIVDWNDRQITLAVSDGERTIDIDQFASLVNQRAESTQGSFSDNDESAGEITVGLKGGTRLCGSTISGAADAWSLTRAKDETVALPVQELKYVRFRKPTDDLRKQWKELLEGEFTGDVLVIRRSANSLDFLEGVIHGVSEQQVVFEFEDERIEVKREKLEGCLFFSRRRAQSSTARMTVRSTAGDLINARRIDVREQAWHLRTTEGVRLILAADQIRSVTFASSRVTFLSDIQPVSTDVTAAIGSLEGPNEYLKLIYAPRFDRGYDGPLRLRFTPDDQIQTFSKGIALHSRTELTFRLDGGNAHLMGLVGLAPESGHAGSARLVVNVDGRVMFERIIQRQADPVALDIDLSGGRRLEILADYGDDGDLGDRLYLCDLRIIK